MSILTELYIFETKNREEHDAWWGIAQKGKRVPYAFVRGFLLSNDLAMIGITLFIGITTRGSVVTRAGLELLFVATYMLILLTRSAQQLWRALGIHFVIIALAVILNLAFPGAWGVVPLYILSASVFYRFPLRLALPLGILCICTLVTTDGVLLHLPNQAEPLGLNLLAVCGLCWFGWTRRTQYLLVVRLHETQEQLREQMARSEELAAERERTRIARDIHDVLSHSLAVLSIQVQAARHLRTRDSERLAAKLDEMAILIRESITESRRVVGLLREKPTTSTSQDELGAELKSMALTFNERTGIRCLFEEHGIPHSIGEQQRETLHLALREMLTNAHRHGAAKTVWITLHWQETNVLMKVQDDGEGIPALQKDTLTQEIGGHHGLQGMRERAHSLGGEVNAGIQETGGFLVSMTLPYEQSGVRTTKAGSNV